MSDSALNTFSKEEADHVVRKTAGNVKILEVVKMPLVNINEVLDKHFKGGAPDFLSIDVEGLDLSILKTLDYKRHRPKVICVETIVMGPPKRSPRSISSCCPRATSSAARRSSMPSSSTSRCWTGTRSHPSEANKLTATTVPEGGTSHGERSGASVRRR